MTQRSGYVSVGRTHARSVPALVLVDDLQLADDEVDHVNGHSRKHEGIFVSRFFSDGYHQDKEQSNQSD
jgi:hypothetical protein